MSITEKYIIRADDRTKEAFASLHKSLTATSTKIAGLVGVAGFGALIKKTIDTGDKIQKLSIRIGASTEALSQYRHVAELSGVTFDSLTTSWQRQTRRIAEAAKGTGEATGALNELNLSAAHLKQLRPEQQFEILAQALSQVQNQSDRVRLAMKFWDTDGVSMLQIAEGGADAIKKMRQEADSLGLTLDRVAADDMAAANDAMTRIKSTVEGFANSLIAKASPAIREFTEYLNGIRNGSSSAILQASGINETTEAAIRYGEAQLRIARITNDLSKIESVRSQITQNYARLRESDISRASEGIQDEKALAIIRAGYTKKYQIMVDNLTESQSVSAAALKKQLQEEIANRNASTETIRRYVEEQKKLQIISSGAKQRVGSLPGDMLNWDKDEVEKQLKERNAMIADYNRQQVLDYLNAQEKITEATRINNAARMSIYAQGLSTAARIFGAMSQIAGKENKKQFEESKAWAEAQVVMSTAVAVMEMYAATAKYGPWVAIPAVAAVGVEGLAQLLTIANTEYSPGSSSSSSSSGAIGTYPASPNTGLPAFQDNQSRQSAPATQTTVNVHIGGEKVMSLMVDGVITAIDNDQLVLQDQNTSSRIVVVR